MKFANLQNLAPQLEAARQEGGQERVNEVLREAGIEPKLLYQELEMNSRYVDTHQETSDSNSQVSLHSHSFYELLYCTNVVDVEYLVGADRYRLQRGDIIVIPPGISHRPLLPERLQAPYRRDVIWISPEFIQSLAKLDVSTPELIPQKPFLLRTAGTRWAYLSDLFRQSVIEEDNKAPGWEMSVLGTVTQLLAHLYRALQDRNAEPLHAEKPQLMDQVMDYIEMHLDQKITLADVAKQFYVSQSTITQTFRNKLGVSFYRCVTQRRLIAAKRMIEKELPLESISMQIGFKDYSSFYRAFKQEYGISPREYRTLQNQLQNKA